jgi:pimeloyl-ACP methyl ester carboxylesterase
VPSVRLNDLSLYFEELGPPEAAPVVLLHGAGATIDDPVGGWAGLAASFAERFHLVLVEHRGHGRTDNPAGSMTFEQVGDDVAALLGHLGLPSAHVAGISDGAVVALDLALRRPEATRSIVVLGGNYCVHDGIRAYAASLDPDGLEQAAPEAVAELARRHDAGKHPGYWKELLRQIVANNTANPTWSAEDLRRIECPTLLVAGENDPFATLDQMVTMKREIPRAEWLVVNHSGHAVHFEHPDVVGPRILDFLSRAS